MTVPDQALIASMATGDTDALAQFVRRFQARVYGLALRMVHDPGVAEEVTQDAFLRAWRHAARYDPRRGRIAPWLLTITHHLAVDAIRLRRDHPLDPETMVALMPETEEPAYDGDDHVLTSLRELPSAQARSVVLSVLYGLTAQEIAEREGIPLGTAKTRIRRGLARLRHALAVS